MLGYTMEYLLILENGTEIQFYLQETAYLYQSIYGGAVIENRESIEDIFGVAA